MTIATKYFIYPWAVNGGNRADISDTAVDPVLSYQDGFTVNYEEPLTTSGALPVPRGQTNQYLYDITVNLKNWQENGIYPFITSAINGGTAFPYAQGALCAYDAGDGNGVQIWQSTVASNTQTPGAGSQWKSLSNGGTPIGTIIDFASATLPFGYLNCNGAAVSQTTYASLYGVIGDTFLNTTTPPGTGNFNLPNLSRFVTMGSGGTAAGAAGGVTGTTVGSIGGAETHTQTGAEVGAHTHPVTIMGDFSTAGHGYASLQSDDQAQSATAAQSTGTNTGGTPFNIVQPTMVLLKCIRAF